MRYARWLLLALVLWAGPVGCNRPEGTCVRGRHELRFHFIQLGPITATYERDLYVCERYRGE